MLMSQVTTLQIGGPAKDFKVAKEEEELFEIIKLTQDFLVIGGGSNLLVADQGIDKLVIQNQIEGITKTVNVLEVKAGTILQHLVDYTIRNGLSGIHKLTGIPGTLGGAVFGNAGAFGQTISDCIKEIKAFDGEKIIILDQDECEFSYRDSVFKKNGWTILEIKLKLIKDDPEKLLMQSNEVLQKRLIKYPPGIKCPGSFFKNIVAATLPKEILDKIPKELIVFGKLPAGSLLEEVGAKGQKLDGIEIAPYHANLFINKGGGTAKAFYDLARKYSLKVKEKFGITLEPEVRLINLPFL